MDKGTSTFDKVVLKVKLGSQHTLTLLQGGSSMGFDHILLRHPELFKGCDSHDQKLQRLKFICSKENFYGWVANYAGQPTGLLFKSGEKYFIHLIIGKDGPNFIAITCYKKEKKRIQNALKDTLKEIPEKIKEYMGKGMTYQVIKIAIKEIFGNDEMNPQIQKLNQEAIKIQKDLEQRGCYVIVWK